MNSRVAAVEPGDIHATFNRSLGFTQYSPSVLSSPLDGPWIVTFDDFLTDEEVDFLLEYKFEYKRSVDVGLLKRDGRYDHVMSEQRTNSNTWVS
jgi:hypothetical protein